MTEQAFRSNLAPSRCCPEPIRLDNTGNVDPAAKSVGVDHLSEKVKAENEGSHVMREKKNGNMSDWSVSRLVGLLKCTFRPEDFAIVEAVLMAREEKSKLEIQKLKQENSSLLDKNEERLDKLNLQDELRKRKQECEELRNAMSKLREENMVLMEREKLAEERCNKLMEKVKIMGEKEHEVIDLRSKNCVLECAKEKAEGEREILKKRFDELDKRVLILEGDIPLLRAQLELKSNEVRGENKTSENGTVNASVRVEEASVGISSGSLIKLNGHLRNAGSQRPSSQNIVQIVDIDSDDDSAPVVTMREKRMTDHVENSHAYQISVENGAQTLKRKRTLFMDEGESEKCDNDGNTLNEKLKMKKLQESVCRPDDGPLNRSSTKTTSSDGNEVSRGFATPKEDFLVSRQCRQQTGTEHKSQNLMNGFPFNGFPLNGLRNLSDESEESSCSSESDSDDEHDGCISPSAILSLHRNLGDKTESSHRK